MGCGASTANGFVIKVIDTGVLKENAFNIGMAGGAAMLWDEDSKMMYLAGNGGMIVVDTFDPTNPKKTGKVIDTGALSDDGGIAFARVGSTLFLAGGKGLKPIDVSDFRKPLLGKLINTGALNYTGGVALALNGSTLYVAGGKGVATFDVTNPTEPTRVGEVMDTDALLRSGGVALCLHGFYLYAVGGRVSQSSRSLTHGSL